MSQGSLTPKTDVSRIGGNAIDSDSGNKSAGTQRVILATDQPQLTNALKVDGSAVTQPVSGTVTITPSGTQTVSGAITANAGTNLNTSLLALESGGNLASLKANTDSMALAQGSTTSGQKGNLILGATTTAAPVYTTAQSNPLSLTTAGALRVDNSANTQPVSGTVSITANSAVNLAQIGGSTVATGSGTTTGALRVELANNGTGVVGLNTGTSSIGKISDITTSIVPGTGAANLGKAEDAVAVSGDTGIAVLGVRNDTLATVTNADGDYTQLTVDRSGRLVTIPFAAADARVAGTATATTTTSTSLVAAGSGSLRNYITSLQVVNTGSSTSLITLQDGSGGTTLMYTIAPAGGGSNIQLTSPIRTTAATALYFTANTASTTIYVSAQGFQAL